MRTEHRPQRPVLLAVDQQLGEGATLRVAPELAAPVGPLEVGEHQDVEQLGAGSVAEGFTLPQSGLSSTVGPCVLGLGRIGSLRRY